MRKEEVPGESSFDTASQVQVLFPALTHEVYASLRSFFTDILLLL